MLQFTESHSSYGGKWTSVLSGVVTGLGVIIFLMYINDLMLSVFSGRLTIKLCNTIVVVLKAIFITLF